MGNWAAEGCQAKSEENQKDSPGAVIILAVSFMVRI
jgi:hypothetical protein